jgi:hypothetical protein
LYATDNAPSWRWFKRTLFVSNIDATSPIDQSYATVLYTFDLIELNGQGLQREPVQMRKAALEHGPLKN